MMRLHFALAVFSGLLSSYASAHEISIVFSGSMTPEAVSINICNQESMMIDDYSVIDDRPTYSITVTSNDIEDHCAPVDSVDQIPGVFPTGNGDIFVTDRNYLLSVLLSWDDDMEVIYYLSVPRDASRERTVIHTCRESSRAARIDSLEAILLGNRDIFRSMRAYCEGMSLLHHIGRGHRLCPRVYRIVADAYTQISLLSQGIFLGNSGFARDMCGPAGAVAENAQVTTGNGGQIYYFEQMLPAMEIESIRQDYSHLVEILRSGSNDDSALAFSAFQHTVENYAVYRSVTTDQVLSDLRLPLSTISDVSHILEARGAI